MIYPFDDGSLYRRPATPPVFDYEIYRRSVIKAAALEASLVCIGHYGCQQDVAETLSSALGQLENWLAIVKDNITKNPDMADDEIFDDLLKRDTGVSRFYDLPRDIQARERYFCMNSIRGMKDYLIRK